MSNPIMTVKEARKLLGEEASDKFTDEEVEEMITQLHTIAGWAIKDYMKKRDAGELPEKFTKKP